MNTVADHTTDVAVVRSTHVADRWTAAVHVDGRATTWDCGHLHQSVERAYQCVERMRMDIRARAKWAFDTTDSGRGYDIVKLSLLEGGLTRERRFTYNDEVCGR